MSSKGGGEEEGIGEFCRKLSRSELQRLCKQRGLPARKSTPILIESLLSYFQRKDLNVTPSGKGLGGTGSFIPSSQHGVASNSTRTSTKDTSSMRPCLGQEREKGSRYVESNGLGNSAEYKRYDKGVPNFQFVSQCAGSNINLNKHTVNLTDMGEYSARFHSGNGIAGSCLRENPSHSGQTTKVPVSFEFYVSSEDGIKLSVDLSSCPSDWIGKYKNQVSICDKTVNTKSCHLHQELGHIGKNNKRMKGSFPQGIGPGETQAGDIPTESLHHTVVEKNSSMGFGHIDEGNNSKSMTSSPLLPGTVALDTNQEENRLLTSCKTNYAFENQLFSNSESCSKNGFIVTLDSDVSDPGVENTACNFAVNSVSDGSAYLEVLERPDSKNFEEGCADSTPQNSCHVENSSFKFPGSLGSHSREVHVTKALDFNREASCSPQKSSELVKQVALKCNNGTEEDVVTTENNHFPSYSGGRGWSNVINGRESSVCSQVDSSFKKTCSKSYNVERIEHLQKKRPIGDGESQNGHSKRDPMQLRSMKHSARESLPRRSSRLVPKSG